MTVADPRALNRTTLQRQSLLERASVTTEDAVRRILAIQAQSPPSPYISLWNRVAGFDPADLDLALADARVVKATLMRITLHAVHADDHGAALHAVTPTLRAARFRDHRFRESGITEEEADELLPVVLGFLSEPRTNQETEAWLAERGAGPRAWWAMRHTAPVRHAVTGPPWAFGNRPSYVATGVGMPAPDDEDAADAALAVLVRRYLEAFGPATVPDVGQFAMVQRGRVKRALELPALADIVRTPGPDGRELLDIPGGEIIDAGAPAPPRLLPMWDSILLAYHDRSRVLPEDLRKVVIRSNGDTLPTVLVDGYVAGVWRGTAEGGIEVTMFRELDVSDWEAVEAEALEMAAFLAGREPQPYGRYRRWFDRLPPGERRVFAPD